MHKPLSVFQIWQTGRCRARDPCWRNATAAARRWSRNRVPMDRPGVLAKVRIPVADGMEYPEPARHRHLCAALPVFLHLGGGFRNSSWHAPSRSRCPEPVKHGQELGTGVLQVVSDTFACAGGNLPGGTGQCSGTPRKPPSDRGDRATQRVACPPRLRAIDAGVTACVAVLAPPSAETVIKIPGPVKYSRRELGYRDSVSRRPPSPSEHAMLGVLGSAFRAPCPVRNIPTRSPSVTIVDLSAASRQRVLPI